MTESDEVGAARVLYPVVDMGTGVMADIVPIEDDAGNFSQLQAHDLEEDRLGVTHASLPVPA